MDDRGAKYYNQQASQRQRQSDTGCTFDGNQFYIGVFEPIIGGSWLGPLN